MFTNSRQRFEGLVQKIAASLLLFSFVFSPIAPVLDVYAQEADEPVESVESDSTSVVEEETPISDETTSDEQSIEEESNSDVITPESEPEVTEPEQTEETQPIEIESVPTPEEEEQKLDDEPEIIEPVLDELIATSTATTTQELIPIGEKFKRNNNLSVEEQLAVVRQYLTREGLPQVAIDRLNSFESERTVETKEDGIFKKMGNFVTRNTEEVIEEREAKNLIKSEPFKVESFEGETNTISASNYEKDFSEAKEQGSFIQKVKNLIENGEFFNADPHGTKEKKGGIISRLLGAQEVMADASDDPEDYLDEGAEIKFSQAIEDKIIELNSDPLAILNFVRNNIEYIPYYGSKKGSAGTMAEFAGNDTDKSALLIAMLRASDVPARYRQVDAKFDIPTVNSLLGVTSANSAAELLSLEKIPYTLYTLNGEPYFFVIEHTYVEAYLPYGVSRGADVGDGGESQWVPMDPTVTLYYYSQPVDIGEEMRDDGFNIEGFFDNYLDGDYGTSTEPLAAYQTEVEGWLTANPLPDMGAFSYDEALMVRSSSPTEFEFIPGSLPFEISADLDTYDFIPSSLRHTIGFTITDDSNEILSYIAYVSDVADKEIIIGYDPATEDDQEIVDGFETIYDVVPLSLVAVTPKLKVGGGVMATGIATTTMGQSQKYKLEFIIPTRDMGESVESLSVGEIEKNIVTGTSEGIALNTDRIIPPEIRPIEDTQTNSFVSDQMLYKTAVDYLYRLQDTHRELASVLGGDFTHIATKASIANGVEVTENMGEPYSFEWKGLRIDAASKVRYFSRINGENRNHNIEEFIGVFGLQASQDESDIFEDSYDVESVATVKGLKLVADGAFDGVSLMKITEANEGDIDSLSISTAMKNTFHSAVGDGKIIYTPSESVIYDDWEGLFYIAIDFEGGDGTYAIGEGLNGGYTVTQWPNEWFNFWRYTNYLTPTLTANIISPIANTSYIRNKDEIYWETDYEFITGWTESGYIKTKNFPLGTITLYSGYGTSDSVTVNIIKGTTASLVSCTSSLEEGLLVIPNSSGKIAEEMHLPMWIDETSETYMSPRYGGHTQHLRQDDIYTHDTTNEFLTPLGDQSTNINDPWIDPKDGQYWNMSITNGAFFRDSPSVEHERYYMNMRWDYYAGTGVNHGQRYFGKKVWIKNPANNTAVITAIGDFGPAVSTGRVAGASPEAMKAIGAKLNSNLEYCFATDQNLPYGTVVHY